MATQKPPSRSLSEKEGVMLLSPTRDVLKIKGKLSYSEGDQAWTILRLKKEILQKYPHLKEKQSNFIYLMKVCDSHEELKQELEQLKKEEDTVPIIFMIGKEKDATNT
jgi:hypothetical protein